jgi:hypothetical protein
MMMIVTTCLACLFHSHSFSGSVLKHIKVRIFGTHCISKRMDQFTPLYWIKVTFVSDHNIIVFTHRLLWFCLFRFTMPFAGMQGLFYSLFNDAIKCHGCKWLRNQTCNFLYRSLPGTSETTFFFIIELRENKCLGGIRNVWPPSGLV